MRWCCVQLVPFGCFLNKLISSSHAVPILPDYLATINNRTLLGPATSNSAIGPVTGRAGAQAATTSYNTPLNSGMAGATGVNASGGLSILDAAASAQHMAYRNLDGTGTGAAQTQIHLPIKLQPQPQSQHHHQYQYQQQQQLQQAMPPHQQQLQHVMTKHPIPGKSMVNFSLIHLATDDNSKPFISSPINPEHGGNSNAIHWLNHSDARTGSSAAAAGRDGGYLKNSLTMSSGKIPGNGHRQLKTETNDELLASENSSIGILLAMKALVQLIFNPIVGNLSTKYGYRLPIVLGTFFLLISSLGKSKHAPSKQVNSLSRVSRHIYKDM